MNPSTPTTYKFTVKSAAEAADYIRQRLGPEARVLSVRTIEAAGLRRWWSAPRIEVIAQAPSELAAEAAGLSAGAELVAAEAGEPIVSGKTAESAPTLP